MSGKPKGPSYQWGPLQAVMDRRNLTIGPLAKQVRVDPRDLYRYRAADRIPEAKADRIAVALGMLPWEVWDDWLDHGMALDREREERRKARNRASSQRYRDRNREKVRQADRERLARMSDAERSSRSRYIMATRDPVRHVASVLRWRSKNPDKVREYQRRYYERNREAILERERQRRREAS